MREGVCVEYLVSKIVSGGQTGVDRAALDVAIDLEIPHGGWCPSGRRSESGVIPLDYQLMETDSADYSVRTERNVLDSNGTLILHFGKLAGGTKLTSVYAKRHHRPCLVIDLKDHVPDLVIPAFQDWVLQNQIHTLNVAGPRESNVPAIGSLASDFLRQALVKN